MSELVVNVSSVSKAYRIWGSPAERLEGAILHAAGKVLPPLRNLTDQFEKKLYRDFYALKDVSLTLRRGETIGIIGRNGSGKSTLLQIIAGTLPPNTGSVQLQGRIAALLELGSGFNPEFTGRENVILNGTILGLTEDQINSRFDAIAGFADIGSFIDQPVKTYSSGMAMRLAFAVVAHVDADVLIVDEALSVGDAFFVQKCMRWIREFKERGSLLFVAHNAADVVALCDRALWLSEGQVMMEGAAKDVTQSYLAHFNQGVLPSSIKRSLAPDKSTITSDNIVWTPSQRDTRLVNSIKLMPFDPTGPSFGEKKAEIVSVNVIDTKTNRSLDLVNGGEHVTVRIIAKANDQVTEPIVGFYVKDRLGQNLFGDNTYLTGSSERLIVENGDSITADFSFQMPFLPRGQYILTPAIATGNQDAHIHQHWIHEGVVLESSNPATHLGIVGIPMNSIQIKITQSKSDRVL